MTQTGPTQKWRQLVATAVLGMDRVRIPPLDGALAKLFAQRTLEGPADFLQAAAVLSVYERAGRGSIAASGRLPTPCDDDEVPGCSLRSGQHLARILYGEFDFLLGNWLTLAATRGVRAPDELLPPLLDRLTNNRDEAAIGGIAVLGKRGIWLAALNPYWKKLVVSGDDDPRAIWQTGERDQRLSLIRRLRSSDPRAARELITQSWEKESGDDRAEIVRTLTIGLAVDDEALLEAALDDSRKPVRQAATDLLARLPESAFCQRMTTRATSLIKVSLQKRILRGSKVRLEVNLPDKLDKALLRDGIEHKRGGGMGERAYFLCQIVAATPLSTWEACGAPPAEIIAEATIGDWREPLLRGWASAAARQGSSQWAEPLLRISLESGDDFDPEEARQLVQALDHASRERILATVLCEPKIALSRSLPLLECCDHPWSMPFSRTALGAMRKYFGTPEAYAAHALRGSFKRRIARYLSPSVAAEVETGWNRTDANWHKGDEELVSALAATLAFRRDMQEELSR